MTFREKNTGPDHIISVLQGNGLTSLGLRILIDKISDTNGSAFMIQFVTYFQKKKGH